MKYISTFVAGQKNNNTFLEFLVLVKFGFLVGFDFLKEETAEKNNLGISLSLPDGARLKLAPKPAA